MSPLAILVNAVVRSLLLAACAGAALYLARVRSIETRSRLWTMVLYAALAMPLLVVATPRYAVILRVLQPLRHAPASGGVVPLHLAVVAPASRPTAPRFTPVAATPASHRGIPWLELIYGVVAGVLLLRLWIGIELAARLRRHARPVTDVLGDGAIAEAAELRVPAVVGVLRPVILLPVEWPSWDVATLQAVLRHEAAHVRRGDALTQRVALLHQALFWFSPLAWWLPAHLEGLADQACDAAVLHAGTEPAAYAEMLVAFLRRCSAQPRVRWQAVGMARGARAEKRLEQILRWKGGNSMTNLTRLTWRLAAVVTPAVLAMAALRPALARKRALPMNAAATATLAAIPSPKSAPAPVAAPEPAGFLYSLLVPKPPASVPSSGRPGSCTYVSYDGWAAVAIGDDCGNGLAGPAGVSFQFLVQANAVEFTDGGKSYRVDDPTYVRAASAEFVALDANNAQQAYVMTLLQQLRVNQSTVQVQQDVMAAQASARLSATESEIAVMRARLEQEKSINQTKANDRNVAAQVLMLENRIEALQRQAAGIATLPGAGPADSGRADTRYSLQAADLAAKAQSLRQRQADLERQKDELGLAASTLVRTLERTLPDMAASARAKGLAHELALAHGD